jgi:hypothetical protein
MSNRRRLAPVAGAIAVIAVAYALFALLGSSTSDRSLAADSARLVPADALVFVHLSTDTGRAATRDSLRLAERFPGFGSLERTLLSRLSAPGCPIDIKKLEKGREAALALIDAGGGSAGSLVLVDTGDTKPIRSSACGELQTEKFGRFYAIGQPQTIQVARELNRGHGKSLAADPAYSRELAKLPQGRVADAWISRDGVRRLLLPQDGLLGVAGTLLDAPGLLDVAASLQPTGQGARLVVRSLRDAKLAKAAASPFKPFTPTLQSAVPGGSFAYLGLNGLSASAGRLLGLVGPQATALGPVIARAGKALQPLLDLFKGEVAVSMIRQAPAPILTIVIKPKDIAKATAVLLAAQRPIARLLSRPGAKPATWTLQNGTYRLRPANGIEIDYAAFGGRIAVSTGPAGIASARNGGGAINQTAGWRSTIGNTSNPVTSLLFLDFSQLLRLGEQTGLNDNKAYLAVKSDLQKIKAVGVHTASAGDESTAELDFLIP